MKAIRLHAKGGPEQLIYEEAPLPIPGRGEVRIRVHAAGITPTELQWPATFEFPDGSIRLPSIPAHEVAGRVGFSYRLFRNQNQRMETTATFTECFSLLSQTGHN